MELNPNFNDSIFEQDQPVLVPRKVLNRAQELVKHPDPIPHLDFSDKGLAGITIHFGISVDQLKTKIKEYEAGGCDKND